MPPGSKKRKSSKKPKPQGEPPELDVGLEEAMASTGDEVGEATPSPSGIEGDPEAVGERGLDGKEVNGKVFQEGLKEDSQIDEASPDREEGGQGDPPPVAEPQPEIPAAIEAEAPAVIEPKGQIVQQGTEPQIDTPVLESEARIDATLEEIKSEVEPDPDTSPVEIKPDADIGLDEIESSMESREFEFDAAPLGSESGIDEFFLEKETKTDTGSADVGPEIDRAPDELDVAAAPAEVKSEIGEPLVQAKPEVDATPYIERKIAESPDEVPVEMESETDGVPAWNRPEAQVEEPETAASAAIEPETEEALRERDLVTDAVPTDVTEVEGRQVEEPETAAPADIEPDTEKAPMERELVTGTATTAEVEEAPVDRELSPDAASADVEPETDAAPIDVEAETKTVQLETDALQDEVPREIVAAIPENETEMDVAVWECESEADAGVEELEPRMEVSPVGNEPEAIAELASIEATPESESQAEALVEGDPEVDAQDVATREPEPEAEDVAAPEFEPEADALVEEKPELSGKDVLDSAEVGVRMASPKEIEPEPKPLVLAEEMSFDPPQEIKPELEVKAIDEAAKLEDEASIEPKAEERGSIETESYQQDFVVEVEAAPESNPEPEVETTRGIELEAEAEVPLEAEPESVVEAMAETELDEKGDQQDLVEIEPDQSGVKEQHEQLQTQDGETSEVPVVEDEPPPTSAFDGAIPMDDSTSSTSSSEDSDNTKKERTAIEPESEEVDDIPQSATALEGEGESFEVVSENQYSGGGIEETNVTAVDDEQGAADVLQAESKEDVREGLEKAVDVGHDEDGDVSALPANGGETKESNYQELALEPPLADVVNMEELAKEDIINQERAVDVRHGKDEDVLASAGNGSEAEVSIEQELGSKQPPSDVVDVEECAKEGPLLGDQEPVTEQPQPLIDEKDMSVGPDAAAEPPSVESEQSLNATLPSSESKISSNAPEHVDKVVTPASGEKFALENEFNLESATGNAERDIEEEEAVSSTVAEAGSAQNDFDERASLEQELPTEFPSAKQDADAVPESVETGSTEQLDSEPFPAETVDVNTVVGHISEQPEVLLKNAEAAKLAKGLHSALAEKMPSDEQVPSSLQPVQVVQDSGKDEVHTAKEVMLKFEEPRTGEEVRAVCEDDKAAADSILEPSFSIAAGDELIAKAFKYLENREKSLASSEVPSNELAEHRDELSNLPVEANDMDKAEVHTMDSKESREVELDPIEGESSNHADDALVESALPLSEGRDIKDVQAFHHENTQEASLPLVIFTQDRAVEQANSKNTERPSGGALQRRTRLLDCCGMFDLLLRKN